MAPEFADAKYQRRVEQMVNSAVAGNVWHADHIVAVFEVRLFIKLGQAIAFAWASIPGDDVVPAAPQSGNEVMQKLTGYTDCEGFRLPDFGSTTLLIEIYR
jgi:hypothetical protein